MLTPEDKTKFQQQAIRFAERTSGDFAKSVQTSCLSVQRLDNEDASAITNIFFDAFVGLYPALAWAFTRKLDQELEDAVIGQIREKFKSLRTNMIKRGANGQPAAEPTN
jgi:hypothetical protein